jgi:hypothetical protein
MPRTTTEVMPSELKEEAAVERLNVILKTADILQSEAQGLRDRTYRCIESIGDLHRVAKAVRDYALDQRRRANDTEIEIGKLRQEVERLTAIKAPPRPSGNGVESC